MKAFLEALEQFAVEVILDRRKGRRAAFLKGFLYLLSLLYRQIVVLRLRFFEWRFARVHALGCLVISVGNLTVGGTGKTPIVEKLARRLTDSGRRVAILSRGYKSVPVPFWQRMRDRFRSREHATPPRVVSDGKRLLLDSARAGDEPYMLAKNLKDVVVVVDRDRVKGGLHAIRRFGVDTLLLDDGFQYLPLKERCDVLLVDRESPFGNRHLLPRGMLREPQGHLKRADFIFLTKCDGSDLSPLKEELRRFNRHAPIVECVHRPQFLENLHTGERQPLEFLRGLRVGAFSGIARPESFEDGLRRLGAEICYSRHFADHHRFDGEEVANALSRSKARTARAVITTEKDAVRIPPIAEPPLPVYFLRVEIEVLHNEEALEALFESWLHKKEEAPAAA
ncbi:MAG: tetraacyldisaccharide 4'-kinase [Verrucomicrobium sp.]|nr:tetraacyldisaccharide 4'-kinase [Verrucomicrobium sp.]